MSKKGTWPPAENFVRNGVEGNITKALKVSTYHMEALNNKAGDPNIDPLILTFTPLHQAVVDSSSDKSGIVGDRMADTQTKDELFLSLMQNKMPKIQLAIENVYDRKSSSWTALFPFGLTPLNTGTIENKISALKTLNKKVNDDGALTAAQLLLDPAFNDINKARNVQVGEKSNVETSISTQQDAIEAMCVGHFSDHGAIVKAWPDQPKIIASFTDYVTLQSRVHGPLYEGTITINRKKMALKKDFTMLSQLKVTSTVPLQIWVIDSINNPSHPIGIFIPANTPPIVGFPALGDFTNRIIQIQNMSLTEKGKYAIEVL